MVSDTSMTMVAAPLTRLPVLYLAISDRRHDARSGVNVAALKSCTNRATTYG